MVKARSGRKASRSKGRLGSKEEKRQANKSTRKYHQEEPV